MILKLLDKKKHLQRCRERRVFLQPVVYTIYLVPTYLPTESQAIVSAPFLYQRDIENRLLAKYNHALNGTAAWTPG